MTQPSAFSVPDCLLAGFAAGLLFGLVYEALRCVRVFIPARWVAFVCDIAFFLLAAAAVTELSTALGNYIRWSTVFGFGAGVFTYVTTVGRLLNIVENAVAHAVQSALSSLLRGARKLLAKFFGSIAQSIARGFGEISKIYTANVKKLHKPLKNPRRIVYNKESRKDNNGGSENRHVIKAKVRRGVHS